MDLALQLKRNVVQTRNLTSLGLNFLIYEMKKVILSFQDGIRIKHNINIFPNIVSIALHATICTGYHYLIF